MNSLTMKTLKVRVKDKHAALLTRMSFECNQVWNAANEETSVWCYVPIPEVGYIRNNLSAFDLQKQLKTLKKERGFVIGSATIQEVIAVHAKARRQFKKDKLKWRVSDLHVYGLV
jgi:putative transposase